MWISDFGIVILYAILPNLCHSFFTLLYRNKMNDAQFGSTQFKEARHTLIAQWYEASSIALKSHDRLSAGK